MNKLFPASTLIFLAPIALHAGLMVTITGTFDSQIGEGLPGLTLPAPYTFKVTALADTLDTDQSDDIGHFVDEAGSWSLDLPGYHFEGDGSEINIWSFPLNYAYLVGNDEGGLQNGFDVADYGLYGQIFVPQEFAPTDELKNLQTVVPTGVSRLYLADVDYIENGGNGRRILDENVETFSVTTTEVPEASAGTLFALGWLSVFCLRYRKT